MNLKLWTIALSLAAAFAAVEGCTSPVDDISAAASGSGAASSSSTGEGATSSTGGTAGGSSGTTTPGSKAQQFYVASVHPALVSDGSPTASCTKCHATGLSGAPTFMADAADASYKNIEAYPGLISIPDSSLLLLHGKHTGPELSQVQHDIVTQWLTMEAEERGLNMPGMPTGTGTMPPVMTLDTALAEFGKCMSITDFVGNGLDQLYQVKTILGGQKSTCGSCHGGTDNLGGNYLSANANATLDAQTVFPNIKRWVTGVYDMNGNFTDLKAEPREYMKGDEANNCDLAKEACHPKYININNGNFTPELMAGIDKFIQTTLDKWHAKACP